LSIVVEKGEEEEGEEAAEERKEMSKKLSSLYRKMGFMQKFFYETLGPE
jgi:hypothetical protein